MKYQGEESIRLEFKSELPKNKQIVKTIIGFCNQHGGKLILGVEDDGTICGLTENDAIKIMADLEKSIYETTSPPIIPKVFLQRIDDKVLLVIEVSEGMNKPYYHYADGLENGTYIRVGKSTIRASSEMIEELKWQSRGISYESLPVYQATPDELDHELIKKFLDNRRQKINIDISDEILFSYKLLTKEHSHVYPTVAGILLFGKRVQYWFSEAMIICSHFTGVSGREAIAAIDCEGTLFNQLEQAYNFVISRLQYSFSIKGVERQETLEVPEVAIREILLNAIIHRNYHLRAPTKIAIYDNRIEIFSPGNFPTPFPSLKLGLTDARNMTISRIFREAKLVEKLGTGFKTTFEAYTNWQLPEPIVLDGEGFVKCILPRREYAGSVDTTDELDKILSLFDKASEISVSDIIEELKIPRSTASRRLSKLTERGDLIKIGRGKSTRYSKAKTKK